MRKSLSTIRGGDEFLRLIEQQPQASFYRAAPQEDVVVYYCHDADFGVWVVPGSGMGPLDATGKRLMKEAIRRLSFGTGRLEEKMKDNAPTA